MQLLKQSTAATVLIGPVLDSTGAAYTSAVIGDFNITKNGTTAAMAATATVTHDHNGMYLLEFTTGNTDTLGRLTVSCNKATYAMAARHFSVLTATTFDALITNAANAAGGLQDIQRLAGQAITAASGVTFPSSIASPTNITAGTITTVTNLTNAPTNGDFTATMKASITTAATAATPSVTVSDKTGFKLASDGLAAVTTWTVGITGNITGNLSGSVGSVSGAVGSVTGNVGGNVVGSVGSVSGAVGSVTGNVGGNVTGSVGSVVAGVSVSGTITTLDALNTSLSTTHGAGSWATATGFSTLDASGVRSAVGLASANLDTQLDALPTAAENSTAVWSAVTRSLTDKSGFSLATTPPTADENAAALLDLANAIESGLTVRQAMRLIVAADAGKVSGGGTTTVTIRDIADTKDRIVATVDSDGNRTAITRDLT